jgi:hypothetical protein
MRCDAFASEPPIDSAGAAWEIGAVKIHALAFILLAACGASETPTSTPAPAPAAAKEKHHHKGATPELEAFHDVLAPRWHSDPGPERTRQTCDAIAEFKSRAAAVAGSMAPTGASSNAWSQAGDRLERTVAELATACGEGTPPEKFDAAFSSVHDAFHSAMALASRGRGMQEGHGEHHHQGSGQE